MVTLDDKYMLTYDLWRAAEVAYYEMCGRLARFGAACVPDRDAVTEHLTTTYADWQACW